MAMKSAVLLIGLTLASICLNGCSPREETSLEKSDNGEIVLPQEELLLNVAKEPVVSTPLAVNSPPRVFSAPFADPYITSEKDIQVLPEGGDPDHDLVEFHYRWFLNGRELIGENTNTLEKGKFKKGDKVALWVIPFDGKEEGPPLYGEEFEIPNAPPQFISEPVQGYRGTRYSYMPVVEDSDGDRVTFFLEEGPNRMEVDTSTGHVLWPISPRDEGEHRIVLGARDVEGMTSFQEFTLTIRIWE